MTWPSVMSPARNFGAHSRIGSTAATKPDVDDTKVVRIHWPMTMRQLSSSCIRLRVSPARSSFSPPSSAMLSPFSRRRVSA